jgi:hypothetical protein
LLSFLQKGSRRLAEVGQSPGEAAVARAGTTITTGRLLMAKKTAARHSSGKAGLRSRGKKLASSRHGFATQPASRKKAGAYGKEEGRKARPKTAGTASRKAGKGGAIAKMKAKRTR